MVGHGLRSTKQPHSVHRCRHPPIRFRSGDDTTLNLTRVNVKANCPSTNVHVQVGIPSLAHQNSFLYVVGYLLSCSLLRCCGGRWTMSPHFFVSTLLRVRPRAGSINTLHAPPRVLTPSPSPSKAISMQTVRMGSSTSLHQRSCTRSQERAWPPKLPACCRASLFGRVPLVDCDSV